MYKKCIFNKHGFNQETSLIWPKFLMYNIAGRGHVTVRDLELIYVRHPDQL